MPFAPSAGPARRVKKTVHKKARLIFDGLRKWESGKRRNANGYRAE